MSASDWLPMRDLVRQHPELKDLAEGQTLHINHDDCPAGKDTKRRLWFTRKGGDLLGHCHHCDLGGIHSDQLPNHFRRRQLEREDVVSPELELPSDLVLDPDDCHPLANVWLNKYGITLDERFMHSIGWSDQHGRVVLPVYQNEGLVCYQTRRILTTDQAPKYLTKRKAGNRHPLFQTGLYVSGGVEVLVEDILSAIKVGRVANATALLGTHVPMDNLEYILRRKPSSVLIWLDDDNPTVREQQRRAWRRLNAFVPTHLVRDHGKDPKAFDVTELQSIIYGDYYVEPSHT